MLTKVYGLLWILIAALMGISAALGFMNSKTILVFGFFIFGLVFMGMLSVLPFWATHHESTKN